MAFEVGIGGNVEPLKRAFKEGISASKQFETSVVTSANRAERAISKNSAAVRGAKKDYTNFNRVIQDAPYGLIGIMNNVQMLIPNIGALSIGINVLMTAVLFAQNGFGAWTRGIGDNTKALDNSMLAGEEYIKTLNQVTQARLNGNQQATQELTTLKVLYSQTQNLTLSQKQRLDAVNQLQKEYPAYFKNISDEAVLAGKAGSAYDRLSASILATSRARAAVDLMSQNDSRALEDEQKIIDLRIRRDAIENKMLTKGKKSQEALNSTYSDQQKAFKLTDEQLLKQIRSNKEIVDLDTEIYNLTTDKNKLNERNLQLLKSINQEIAKGAKLTGGVGDIDKDGKNNRGIGQLNFADNYTGLLDLEARVRKSMEKSLFDGSKKAAIVPVEFGAPILPESAKATGVEIFKEYFDYDLLPKLGTSFEHFFNDILEKGEFSFKALGQSIKKTFASVLASEATQGLLNALGQKGKAAEGKGGLFSALSGLLKGGKSAAGAPAVAGGATPGTAGAAGVLGGLSPGILIAGGALIAGSLIKNIVDGINKRNNLPNLYGPGGSSYIGESRTRGNDLLHTWYRTQKRKGR